MTSSMAEKQAFCFFTPRPYVEKWAKREGRYNIINHMHRIGWINALGIAGQTSKDDSNCCKDEDI